LLGILLGFGKHNSMIFQKREEVFDDLEKKKTFGIYNLKPIQDDLNLFRVNYFCMLTTIMIAGCDL
jgi:hypothetical protein